MRKEEAKFNERKISPRFHSGKENIGFKEWPIQEDKNSRDCEALSDKHMNTNEVFTDDGKEVDELIKAGSFTTLDAQFFQSLNDFKSDFLFNKTESILSKPPHIYRQEKIEEAINDCNALIQLDPENAGAYYIRGCCFQKLNDLESSIQDYTTVLEIDPNHINAAYARGACENKRGNFDKAIEDYHMALEKDKRVVLNNDESGRKRMINHNRLTYQDQTPSALIKENDWQMEEYKKFDIMNTKDSHIEKRAGLLENEIKFDQNMKGYSNKNVLLSPGGQMNSFNLGRGRRDDSMTSQTHLKMSKQNSDISHMDRSDPIHRLSKASSVSSSTTHLQNTPHEETKSNISMPATPSYSQTASPSNPNHYRMLKKEAEQLHSQGYAARKQGDYNSAIFYYSKALEVLPTHFKALFNRGFAYDKIGEYDKAIKDYTKAIEIDPQNAFTYYNKGISLDRKAEYDEAIWFFTKAIELEPKKADFYHNRGFAYRKKKEYQKAIEDYTRAIEINNTHFKAYYNRAFCWDKLGNFEEAENDYANAVELQNNNISALHHLGTVREKLGGEKLSLALENFNTVIELNPKYSPSYNGRGLVWDRFFNFEEAIKDFSSAIELDSNNAVYWHNRACCYRNMGLLDEAIEDFNRAVELDQYNPIIYSNRGLVKRKQENFVEAIEDYTLELKFGPERNIKAFNNRAYCFAKIGQFEQAIDDYTNVIDIDSKNIHALHNRGISFERIGEYKAAIDDFTEVLCNDPENANAYFNRGCCYDSIGELDLAISDYSIALELDMKNGNEEAENANLQK